MGEENQKLGGEEKKCRGGTQEEKNKVEDETEKGEEKEVEKPVEEGKKPEELRDTKDEKSFGSPKEIILKVYMHCEGCARKVRRCLKGFEGVENVITDYRGSTVVVKGETADPGKVLERVQRKSHRKVELLFPISQPAPEQEKKNAEEKVVAKPNKKEEVQVIMVVLRVFMHCEACAMEIKKRIQKMKGVESADADLKSSEVTVKGVFEASKLVDYVYKRTGKHAIIMKQEAEKKEDDAVREAEGVKEGQLGGAKQMECGGGKGGGEGGGECGSGFGVLGGGCSDEQCKDKKENNYDRPQEGSAVETKLADLKRNEYYHYPPRYAMELYAYPPQLFSDENPNACSVM